LNLDSGNYRIEVDMPGFTKQQREVIVTTGINTAVAFTMAVGAIEAAVNVTAESPVIDFKKTGTATTLSREELQSTPQSKDPWAMLKTVPGVLVDRVNVGGNEGGTASVPGTAPAEIPKVDRSIESGKTPGAGPLGYDALRLDAESRDAGGEAAGVPGRAAAGEPGGSTQAPSTGGTEEPNDLPYGDVFFREYGVNPFLDAEEDRLSTFGLDVDTGSYTVVRRYLTDGHLPPREAVRIEELVNFFRYGDPAPAGRSAGDFALFAEGAPTPFAAGERYRVLRLAVRGREIAAADRKSAVLTFVVDVSGSMNQDNRLGLVKRALALLLAELSRQDRVGLVVYGSRGRVLLEPTSDLEAIRAAIAGLSAEGSTNAEEGLRLGFEVASRHFRPGAINRLILCSDGVANVGATGPESILARVEAEARRGIELTTVGFGMGNYNDVLMEQLADRGDGRYAYVDDLGEARRIFVEELTGTLETIASDAKAQVEFNPQVVSRWRLLGYENRDIADERFRDDTVDAGEIGAGHWVTALYEVKLQPEARRGAVLATLRLRWRSKAAGEVVEQERELPVGDLAGSWEGASPALRLASLVAEFGEVLKGSFWARQGSMAEVFRRAQRVVVDFPGDASVAEFASLAGRAAELLPSQPAPAPEGER
jgi:Ca-activated chloride channel family protein